MTTRIPLNPIAAHIIVPQQQQILPALPHQQNTAVPSTATAVTYQPPQHQPHLNLIEINVWPAGVPTGAASLSKYLRRGRKYHPLCRQAFMERRVIGYYHYERHVEYRTCAIAAAYAGAFGPQAIEEADFSYSMAIWRLSQKVGYDLNRLQVYGPTGRYQPLTREIIQLVDKDLWTREGVAEWLESLRL